jgi:hypothetical protein
MARPSGAPARPTRAETEDAAARVPPSGYATTPGGEDADSNPGMATTAIQAAGELGQIGLTTAGQALRSALRRLPRP